MRLNTAKLVRPSPYDNDKLKMDVVFLPNDNKSTKKLISFVRNGQSYDPLIVIT